MRDMKTKFGAEVESFRYAFVIPTHVPGWDQPLEEPPTREAGLPSLQAAPQSASAPRRRATDKQPTFIEVKPRGN